MDTLLDLVLSASKWTRLHLSDISLAIIASALVLFGPTLNAWVRGQIGHMNTAIRTLCFALVCTIGYGAAMIYLPPVLMSSFAHLNNYSLAPVLVMIFSLIGILADRN